MKTKLPFKNENTKRKFRKLFPKIYYYFLYNYVVSLLEKKAFAGLCYNIKEFSKIEGEEFASFLRSKGHNPKFLLYPTGLVYIPHRKSLLKEFISLQLLQIKKGI